MDGCYCRTEGVIPTQRLIIRTAPLPPIGLALVLALAGSSPGFAQQPVEPFTASARWSHYLHRTYGPDRMAFLAADTAFDQIVSEPGCRNFTATSYGHRYARAFERRVIKNSAELAGGILTGEDLRYRRSGSGSMAGRLWNAWRASVTAHMPDGTVRPAYTRFAASELARLSTGRWTTQRIQPRRFAMSLGWSAFDQAQTNMLDEFGPDLRRMGSRIWKRVRLH